MSYYDDDRRNDRLLDLEAGQSWLEHHYRTYPVTCLVMLLTAGVYALIRLASVGKLPVAINFHAIWQQSVLSLDAVRDGRVWTILSCYLFEPDFYVVLATWVGLWCINSHLEWRVGGRRAFLFLLVPAACGSGFFLLLSWLAEVETREGLAGLPLQALDLCRPARATYGGLWRPCPLWFGPAVCAAFLIPRVGVLWDNVPLWLFVGGMLAVEFTALKWVHRQEHAFEWYLGSGVAGFLLAGWLRRKEAAARRR